MNRQSITICPTRIYLFPAPLNAGSSSSSQASSINVLSKHTRCPNWNEKRTRVPLFQHKMYKLNSWNWSLNQLSKLNPQVDPFLSSSTTWLYACTFIVKLLAQHHQTIESTDYGHTKAKSLIICGPNSNPIIHVGEKPHECNLCDVKFRQKIHLTTHLKSKAHGHGVKMWIHYSFCYNINILIQLQHR